jgi:predicted metal-dependent peptidase
MSIISFDELTADEKIIKSIAFLNRHYPFFARIMLAMTRHEVDKNSPVETMAINQYGHLYFNTEFVNKLTFDNLQACLAHECCHVAFLTFQRQKDRDPELWNVATDISINWILVEAGMKLPEGVLLPNADGTMNLPKAKLKINVKDIPAEKVYELLEKEAEKVKANYSTMDTHLEGDGDDSGGNTGDASDANSSQKNDHKWKQVCANAAAFAKNRGNLSGCIERMLNDILNPKLNWKEVLNKYITKELPFNYSYNRPSKRSHALGIYMPHELKENLNVIVTCDVSGSIGDAELNEFLSEVFGICTAFEQVKARLIFWSTKVFPEDDIQIDRESIQQIVQHKPKSTGGTTISCVSRYMYDNNIQSRINIHLTDGYVEEKPSLPEGINICVISKHGSDSILAKTDAIICSLADDGK